MNAYEDYINGISPLDYVREQNKSEACINDLTHTINGKEKTISFLEKRESVQEYVKLLGDDYVQRYIQTKEELNNLEYDRYIERRKLQLLKQQLCKHPAILVTEEIKTHESLDDDQIGQGIKPKEVTVTYGICLVCQKRLNPVIKDEIDADSLLYIKERCDSYFIEHNDVIKAQEKFDMLKKGRKCSYKDLTKRLARKLGE